MSTRSTITPCMIVAILFLFVPNMTIYYFQCNYSLFYWPKQQVTEDSGRLFTGSNDQTVRSYDIKVPNTINVACEQAFAAFFVCLLVCFLPSFLPIPLPPLSFFGSRSISRAAKTENPVPRSFFAPKPNGNACYEGFLFRISSERACLYSISLFLIFCQPDVCWNIHAHLLSATTQ